MGSGAAGTGRTAGQCSRATPSRPPQDAAEFDELASRMASGEKATVAAVDALRERLTALAAGASLVLCGGWSVPGAGNSSTGHAVMYVVERLSDAEYAFTVCNTGEGIGAFHPSKPTAKGEVHYRTAMRFQGISAEVCARTWRNVASHQHRGAPPHTSSSPLHTHTHTRYSYTAHCGPVLPPDAAAEQVQCPCLLSACSVCDGFGGDTRC